jgi:hypothetical protein
VFLPQVASQQEARLSVSLQLAQQASQELAVWLDLARRAQPERQALQAWKE